MAKVDLRKKPTQEEVPFKPNNVDRPGVKGTLPFKMGGVFHPDADDIPDTIRREAQAIRDEIPAPPPEQLRQAVKKLPEPVRLEELPEDKQEEILEAIKRTAETPRPAPVKQERPFVPRSNAVARAKSLAERVERATAEPRHEPEKLESKVQLPEKPPEVFEDDEPIKTPPADPVVGTCIHCGWPVGKTDRTNPTTRDKQAFVASVLGQKRFYKTYDLFAGQLRITFRTLTTDECDLVVKQLVEDWNQGKISGPAHSVAEATRYQLTLGLEAVETSVGTIKLPVLAEYEYDTTALGKDTVLPDVIEYVRTKALTNETLRRVVAKAYGHFMDTVSKLEAMAEDSDFWQATED
jgi:hypothetical protein